MAVTTQKRLFVMLLCLLSSPTYAVDPTHFTDPGNGGVYKYAKNAGSDMVVQMNRPLVMLYAKESEDGRLALLAERSGPYWNYGEAFRQVNESSDDYYLHYDPDGLVFELIVCDPKGMVEATAPIRQRHGGSYSHSTVLSRHVVMLTKETRLHGIVNWTFINVSTNHVWSFDREIEAGDPVVVSRVSGTGEHVLNRVGKALLLDGTQVFPCYDTTPASAWVSADEYARSRAEIDETIRQHPERGGDLILPENPWSPDGRSIAFLQAFPRESADENEVRVSVLDIAGIDGTQRVDEYFHSVVADTAVTKEALRGARLQWSDDATNLDLVWNGEETTSRRIQFRANELRTTPIREE